MDHLIFCVGFCGYSHSLAFSLAPKKDNSLNRVAMGEKK
jgi:hypothetical protein